MTWIVGVAGAWESFCRMGWYLAAHFIL
jgi:hypothetical protein